MAIYYVRTNGGDSNAGTSPGAAWRTIGKALSSTGATSGDTVYVGSGVYRESILVTATPTSELKIIGDVTGFNTGDIGGEIQLTARQTNDDTVIDPSSGAGNANVVVLNGKSNLTFKNISFIGGNASNIITALVLTSTNIKFLNCCFFANTLSSIILRVTIGYNIFANWVVDSCYFFQSGSNSPLNFTLTTGTGADYNAGINIINCMFLSNGGGVGLSASGALAGKGGGVAITNCTFIGGVIGNCASNVSIIYPMLVMNCINFGQNYGTCLSANVLGQIIENYNILDSTTIRNLVPVGMQTISDRSIPEIIYFGQENIWGGNPRPVGMLYKNSPLLSHGNFTIAPPNDILGNSRPQGNLCFINQGSVSSATTNTLTDSTKNFGTSNNLNGYSIKIVTGAGMGQTKTINGNTSTTITGDGNWITQPDSTSQYIIYQGPLSSCGQVTSGTTKTLIDTNAVWGNNFWQGYTCQFTSGTSKGRNFIVSGNSFNTITGYQTLDTSPISGDVYELFWGGLYKGTVSTGTAITMQDNKANWNPSGWMNYACMITSGTAAGSYIYVSGHSSNTLSGWLNFATTPKSGDLYAIYQYTGWGASTGSIPSGYVPPFGRNYINCAVGCYEVSNTAIKETGTVLSGSNSIRLCGQAFQDFQVPVSGATTLNVWGYFDPFYSGIVPQMLLKNGSGIGVADATGSLTNVTGAWNKISLSFTPANVGVITARLQSNSSGIGSCFFDSFSIG